VVVGWGFLRPVLQPVLFLFLFVFFLRIIIIGEGGEYRGQC
jgi:hypothetical protein